MQEGSIRWFWQALRRLFPSGWAASTTNALATFDVLVQQNIFENDSKLFDALTLSLGYGFSKAYNDVLAVQNQLYLQTATGTELDLIAQDYFGDFVTRSLGQSDSSFRKELQASFFKPEITVRETALRIYGAGNFRVLTQTPQGQAWNVSNWGWNSPLNVWCSRTATAQVLFQVPKLTTALEQEAANRALAVPSIVGVRIWATTDISGPPQPFGGAVIKHVLPKYAVGAPFVIRNAGLASLLGGIPKGPFIKSPSTALAALLHPQASSPSNLTPSDALLTALS